MENEGIMSLPAGGGMQEGGRQLPAISSADAYDAATQALELKNPGALAPYRQSMRNKIAQLDISPEELGQFVLLIEFLMQDPGQYRAKIQRLIQAGALDPGQFPEEFDPVFLGTILSVLQEYRMAKAEGAQPPEMPGMPPMPMAKGGLASVAQYLQSMGRDGDTILAHINPQEAALLKRMGGAGTINPATGLPEFRSLWARFKSAVIDPVVDTVRDIVKSPIGRIVATVALASVLGPSGLALVSSSAAAGAIAGGTVALAAGGGLKEAVIGASLGYIGGGGEIAGVSPLESAQGAIAGVTGAAPGTVLNTGLTAGMMGTGAGLAMGQSLPEALKTGALTGLGAGAFQGIQGLSTPTTQELAGASPIDQAAAAARGVDIGAPAGAEGIMGVVGAPTGVGPVGAVPAGGIGDIGGIEGLTLADTQALAGGDLVDVPTPDLTTPVYDPGTLTSVSAAPEGSRFGFDEGTSSGEWGTQVEAPKGMFGRMGDFAKDPSFENLGKVLVDPTATTFIGKYGPGMALGLGTAAAGGAFKREQPDLSAATRATRPIPYPYTPGGAISRPGVSSTNIGVATPGLFSVGSPATPATPSPVPPLYLPTGVTNQPQGILQPYNVAGLYGVPRQYYNEGGTAEYPRKTGAINGPGTGTSDSIPAMLSDGEFVFTAKAVRNAGGGSRRKGAKRMYKLMRALEHGGMVKG